MYVHRGVWIPFAYKVQDVCLGVVWVAKVAFCKALRHLVALLSALMP
jgi:hypothetical protein